MAEHLLDLLDALPLQRPRRPPDRIIDLWSGAVWVAIDERRFGCILQKQLNAFRGLAAGEDADDLKRLGDARRYSGSCNAKTVALGVDDEARISGNDFNLGEQLQGRDRSPVRRRFATVEKAGGRKQERADTHRRGALRSPPCRARKPM